MLRLFIFLCLAIPAVCVADTLNVPGDYGTIQEAIDAASEGDTVQVEAGTYMENIDFMGKAITVTGVDGAGSTFIDGGSLGSVVNFAFAEGNDSVLQGFTITNGYGGDGGGVFCDFFAEPTLRNLRITANEAYSYGGGIFAKQGSPVVDTCEVDDNTAWNGGGMECLGLAPVVTNCIFWDNKAGNAFPEIYDIAGGMVVTYCDVLGGYPGAGNINANPGFVAPGESIDTDGTL